MRALSRKNVEAIGNFWVDLTRSVAYLLPPLAAVGSLVLVWQGVVIMQKLAASDRAHAAVIALRRGYLR